MINQNTLEVLQMLEDSGIKTIEYMRVIALLDKKPCTSFEIMDELEKSSTFVSSSTMRMKKGQLMTNDGEGKKVQMNGCVKTHKLFRLTRHGKVAANLINKMGEVELCL